MTINNANSKAIEAGRGFSQMDPMAIDEADLLNIAGGLPTTTLTERPSYTRYDCPPPPPPQ